MTTPHTKHINPVGLNCSICGNTYRANCLKMLFSFNFGNCGECQGVRVCTLSTCPSPSPLTASNLQYFNIKYRKFSARIPPKTSPRFEAKQKLALDVNFFRNGGGFSVEMCLCRPPSPFRLPQILFIFYRIVEYYTIFTIYIKGLILI